MKLRKYSLKRIVTSSLPFIIFIVSVIFLFSFILQKAPKPKLHIDWPCLAMIDMENETIWNLVVKNVGHVQANINLCIESEHLILKRKGRSPTNYLCSNTAIGANDNYLLTINLITDKTVNTSSSNIKVKMDCLYSIFYPILMKCDGIDYICIYKKVNKSFVFGKVIYRL